MAKMPKMPIDVMAVFQEATDVEAARSVSISVSVLLDESAPADLTAFVRASFASASPQARVSVNYFDDGAAVFDPRSDMAVIAAGVTPEVGDVARRLRDAGVPTMVVTSLPDLVRDTAEMRGYAIPEGDLVFAQPDEDGVVPLADPMVVRSDGTVDVGSYDPADPFTLEPYPLTAELQGRMSDRMGEWVVAAFREKRLAFAQAFPFVRRPLSMEAVRATSLQNAGVGFVVFIPGADLPVMTLNQAKMVLQIAAAYGQPITVERVKELAAVVGGGFACRAAARQLVGVVPALGWAIKAAVGYAGTMAMGRAAMEYFEHGGNMAGIAGVVGQARDAAVRAMDETNGGRAAKEAAKSLVGQAKRAVVSGARDVASGVPQAAADAVRAAADAYRAARETTR